MGPLLPIVLRRVALFMVGAAAGAIARDLTRDKVDPALEDLKEGAVGIVKDIQRDIQKNPPTDYRKKGLEPGKIKE